MLTARGLSRGAVNAVLQPKDLLREGNGLLNIGFAAASVGGAALGGLLVDLFGISTALLVDAASFAVIAVVLGDCASLPRTEAAEPEPFLAARARGAALRAHEPGRAVPDRRRGARGHLLHADRADRDRLRGRDAADRRARLRHPAVVLGRRDRARQPRVPGRPPPLGERAHPFVHARDRLRLPRDGGRARAVGGVRVLGRRRPRQRHPVGVGHDRAAGVDARRPPGARSPGCSSR